MTKCINCGKEFDEKIAEGVCPFCGTDQNGESIEDDMTVENGYQCLTAGTVLNGRYVVQKVIGAGGFGITYKALDNTTGVHKAIKEYFQVGVVNRIPGTTDVIISAPKRRDEFEYGKKRLLNEAQIVAKFQSEGIVRVDDYFEENNTSYMVMEYIDSETLEKAMVSQRRLFSVQETIDIGVKIAEALDEIHAAGVIHRDIAPDNLFISKEGGLKIIDFGSARLSREDVDDRLIVLKPGFAPPEQYEKIDPKNDRQKAWTDVYALGATLYLCLTGIVPPESSDRKSDMDEGKDRLKPPMVVNSNVPEWLNNTIMTAMAINTHERFQNAMELKEALLQKRTVLPIEKVRKKKKFRRTTGIVASIAVVLIVSIYGVQKYINKRNDVVLERANITVWYSVDESEKLANEKKSKMEEIIKLLEDSDMFADVNIELVDVPKNEYEQRIKQADSEGKLPNLFERIDSMEIYSSELAEVESILKDNVEKCYLLDNSYSKNSEIYDIATGFDIPVIYINKALASDYSADMVFSKMEDLLQLCNGNVRYTPIAIDNNLYEDFEKMFPDLESIKDQLIIVDSIDSFLEGIDTPIYLGSTKDYYTIRESMAGAYAMEPFAVERVICRWANKWSVKATESAEESASISVLRFLLENNAQDRMYLQTSLPGLPIEKNTLKSYPSVRPAFQEFLNEDVIKRYVVN